MGGRARHGAAALSHGWRVVATLCVTEVVSWGILYYGFPVFLASLERDLDASRAAITGAFTMGMAIAALGAVPVGRWLDRRGPWALMTLGSCLGTALLVAWSRVESLAGLYVIWTLMGLALAATLYEPAFGAVVRWFPLEHRDRALTIVTLAGALASTVFMPVEAWLVSHGGWRHALLVLAAVLAVLTIPPHAVVLRRQPPRLDRGSRGAPRGSGATLGAASRTPIFWALAAAFSIANFSTTAVTLHLIPYMVANGRSAVAMAAAIGWMGAMQIPGRLLFVAVTRRFGALGVTMTVFVAQAVGLALVALAPSLPGGLLLMVAVLGAANGMSTLARATTLAEVFGPAHYASIGGAVALGANGARAAGPLGAALLYQALGGYRPVFWTLAGALVAVGAAVALAARERGPVAA
ncbi:MAG TPA: MFS transporter [Methylomirabilota bacterium]|nr:MFS transporter [Methylomirabilota bacterium]